MKKLILCGSALLLSLGFVNAQGITTTSAYDDFQGTGYVTTDAPSINWFGGTNPWTRTAGKLSSTSTTAVQYYGVDFGTNTITSTKLCLDLSSMADILLDVENASTTQHLSMRIVLEDFTGKQTQIEPNVSDCDLVFDTNTPLDADYAAWPANWNGGDPAVYPLPAYNGFILPKNTRKTLRFDLSSVPGSVGGRKAGPYTAGDPSTMPPSSYDFDATKVHAVLFIVNETTNFTFSNGASEVDGTPNAGGYKYDTTAAAGQADYAGTINFYSFKIGSVLSALPADPTPLTGVTKATVVDNSLKVYPNPAKEVLNVSFESTSGATVTLTDLSGHAVYTTSANVGTNNLSVNTSGIQSGMYILNVSTDNGNATRKVSIR